MHWVELSDGRSINLCWMAAVEERDSFLALHFGRPFDEEVTMLVLDKEDILKIKLEIAKSIEARRRGFGDGKH